jgi:serine/threonine protein kinase
MAPEVNGKNPYNGPPVDIFSCGVILFVLLSCQRPFDQAMDR